MTFTKKTRFFIAVEGKSEQSLITYLQLHCDNQKLAVHLDTAVLRGKSYEFMLNKAIKERNKKNRVRAKKCILLVDADVGNFANGWSCQELKDRAGRANFEVCFQQPKHEALLCRMHKGNEQGSISSSKAADEKLKKLWPSYQKPVNAQQLNARFCLDDLLRATAHEPELKRLLEIIGLILD